MQCIFYPIKYGQIYALLVIYSLKKLTREELAYCSNQYNIVIWILWFQNGNVKCKKKIVDTKWLLKIERVSLLLNYNTKLGGQVMIFNSVLTMRVHLFLNYSLVSHTASTHYALHGYYINLMWNNLDCLEKGWYAYLCLAFNILKILHS